MAEVFLSVLIEKLSSLIEGEIGGFIGVNDEIHKLSSNLTTIQAVLADAEMKQPESRAIQNWLIKLNALAYEIDDILDECQTEVSKRKHEKSKISKHLKKFLFRYEIGKRIKEVTKKLDAVAAERHKFHLREMVVEMQQIDYVPTRETGSVLNVSHHVYGREVDASEIVEILINEVRDTEEISVVPIIGVGGLGKTTLAQLVFNDEKVQKHFEKRLWVCVSDNFDPKTLLKSMIESLTRSASDLVHLDSLQIHLQELLNQKRYLIVLDDVWNEDQEKWFQLRNVLACGSTGSSVIVTTRMKKVADIMGTLPPHYLRGLSKEHCWMLLEDCAFGHEKGNFPNLEAIGKLIVKKCAGVPMAAKALGGLLRFKRTEKEWIYVRDSEIWELPKETLILPALRLSYHHLPLQLRQCFAYCAVFPKDSVIPKRELIFNWMAHGYISSKGVLQVEDVGEHVCNELVLRSLLQCEAYGFQMHDLVHDLAQSIMENKIPGTELQKTVRSASGHSKIRQVNLQKRYVAFPTSNQSEMDMSFILMNFFRLRILDASKSGIQDLPSTVCKLKHLRQLNLSETNIRTLPESLCSLWNLQVLNLNGCEKLVALPKKLRCLINLHHLFLVFCSSLCEMPSRIGELTCLKTLSRFIVGQNCGNQLEELQCLNIGGSLEIYHLERVGNPRDAKKANLVDKRNLFHLSLLWQRENASSGEKDNDEKVLEALEPHPNLEVLVIGGFLGRCFPLWMSNSALEKLGKIKISNCDKCLHLPQLGELPHLKYLDLRNLALVEYIIEDDKQVQSSESSSSSRLSVQYFPSLEILYLWSLPNLKGLLKEQYRRKAFPNLDVVSIMDCSSLLLPPLVAKKLTLLNCSSSNLVALSTKLEQDILTLTDLYVTMDENTRCIPIETLQKLSNLKELSIDGADEVSLPEEGMRALSRSLKTLTISNCKTLRCVPEGWLRHLTALKHLRISECPELVELHLSSSLKSLQIRDLVELNSLPDWLGDLTSLRFLNITNCPKIASLPATIRQMPNLTNLSVHDCPELERRCIRERGEDWQNISHIPSLHIGENT